MKKIRFRIAYGMILSENKKVNGMILSENNKKYIGLEYNRLFFRKNKHNIVLTTVILGSRTACWG